MNKNSTDTALFLCTRICLLFEIFKTELVSGNRCVKVVLLLSTHLTRTFYVFFYEWIDFFLVKSYIKQSCLFHFIDRITYFFVSHATFEIIICILMRNERSEVNIKNILFMTLFKGYLEWFLIQHTVCFWII